MARNVYDNGMVAHVWAQQRESNGRSSNGNFSFSGDRLYSYSTVIAQVHRTRNGQRCVLFNSKKYSKTTSNKHMPAAWSAVNHGRDYPVWTVPDVSNPKSAENLATLIANYRSGYKSAMRAQAAYYDYRFGQLEVLSEQVKQYAEAFDIETPDIDVLADQSAIAEARAARDAKNSTPEAVAKRSKEAEARQRRAEAKLQLALAEKGERVEAWRNRAPVFLRSDERLDESRGVFLRVVGNTLETSMGATVPLGQAIKVFRFVRACRERGQAWHSNGHVVRVGHFMVDQVNADGSFTAGCHRFNWLEIERTAIAAGLWEDTFNASTAINEALEKNRRAA